jgi:segregation and condensation protein B
MTFPPVEPNSDAVPSAVPSVSDAVPSAVPTAPDAPVDAPTASDIAPLIETAPSAPDDGGAGADVLDRAMIKRVLEAALFSAGEPLATSDLRRLFDDAVDADAIRSVLEELRHDWHSGSVELTAVATGWRFRVRPEYQRYLDRLNPEKPPKYSRAVMETLAIIAYRQPVTRADIEQIRGVTVSAQTLKALEDRGWIQVLGQLDKPGRPSIFGTTKAFLNDLNLKSESDLPPLEELQAALDMTGLVAVPASVEPSESASSEEQAEEPAGADGEMVADANGGLVETSAIEPTTPPTNGERREEA